MAWFWGSLHLCCTPATAPFGHRPSALCCSELRAKNSECSLGRSAKHWKKLLSVLPQHSLFPVTQRKLLPVWQMAFHSSERCGTSPESKCWSQPWCPGLWLFPLDNAPAASPTLSPLSQSSLPPATALCYCSSRLCERLLQLCYLLASLKSKFIILFFLDLEGKSRIWKVNRFLNNDTA